VTGRANGESLTVRVNAVADYATWRDASGSWTPIQMQAAGFGDHATVADVVGTRGRFVAGGYVGSQNDASKSRRAAVWTSTDGRSWRRQFLTSEAGKDRFVDWMGAGRSGFLAVGRIGADRIVWFSPDGNRWSVRARSRSLMPKVNGVVATDDGWLVFGSAIWTSRDGTHWRRVLTPRGDERLVNTVAAVVRVADGWRAYGVLADRDSTVFRRPTAWSSSNGVGWREVGPGFAGWTRSVASRGNELLLVSLHDAGPSSPRTSELLRSTNGGASVAPDELTVPADVGFLEVSTVGPWWVVTGAVDVRPVVFPTPVPEQRGRVWVRQGAEPWLPSPAPAGPAPVNLTAVGRAVVLMPSDGGPYYLWNPPDGR
jgi:hypothetical protein